MKDNAWRRVVKAGALAVFYCNLYAARALARLMGRKPYQLGGSCQGCAKCCEEPGIQVSPLVWHTPALRNAFLWWQRTVNGFEYSRKLPAHRVFLFRCSHFDWETRRCDSYGSRPGLCRDYPRNQLWQDMPRLFEGCGYRPIHCNAAQMIERLRESGLDGEKLAEVKKKMYLE